MQGDALLLLQKLKGIRDEIDAGGVDPNGVALKLVQQSAQHRHIGSPEATCTGLCGQQLYLRPSAWTLVSKTDHHLLLRPVRLGRGINQSSQHRGLA